jgi:Type IV secretory system Conjugative DNA transfer
VGRYGRRLQELLGLPGDGQGVPFGSFRPADVQLAVEELSAARIKELDGISRDAALSYKLRSHLSGLKFHTYEDFCLELKNRRPGKKDIIGFGSSLERGNPDLKSYLEHIRGHDPDFADFLEAPQPAAIAREDFETSVYITGKTKSGKSYLSETIAHALARQEKTSVWVIDPHGPLARGCADWKDNLGRNVFYFDAGLHPRKMPRWNPFDQLPDTDPKTLDIATQEQVKAFSVIADKAGLSGNMENFLSPCIHLMLASPNGSLQELFRLMDDNRNADLVAAGQNLQNPRYREFFRHDFSKKTFKATKEAIAIRLSGLLSFTAVYNITNGRSTFSIPKAFNEPGIYIFNLSRGELGGAANVMFGRLILANLQAAAFKRDRDKQTEKNVPTYNCVLIDECHNFVNETTGTIVSETRKYGLMLFLIQQFVGQHIEPALFKEIMTNTPLKFTGVGTAGTYESVAQAQQADRESFYGLKPRLFHVSKSGAVSFIARASSLLAGREARMTAAEWRGFVDAQLGRWYAAREAKDVSLVSGADPEEYAHERPLKPPPEAIAAPAASPPPPPAPAGVFAALRRKLSGQPLSKPPAPAAASRPPAQPAAPVASRPPVTPAAPPRASPPQPEPPRPEDSGFEPEVEIALGQFYSRRKPKFPLR